MFRCTKAIKFGVTLHTRCMHPGGDAHPDSHLGKGLAQFSYQRIEWFTGDQREYDTDRDDEYAWEA